MIDLRSLRTVGSTPAKVTPLGLGVAPLGNLYAAVSEADAESTFARAQSHGINFFDVAPYYGFGLAEQRLGNFLKRNQLKPPVVSTKVGRILEPVATPPSHKHFISPAPFRPVFDYSRAGIERSYEESLRRLGLARAEVLLLHDIDQSHHPQGHRALIKQVLDEALPVLQRLKSEGRVDAIGLGVGDWEVGYEVIGSADVDCVLLAGRYTLLDQSALTSGFLDTCIRKGVSVFAAGVFNSGFLAGGDHFEYSLADEAKKERRKELKDVCARHEVALPSAALQFTAFHPAIASVLVGARSPKEVDEIIGWSRAAIPAQLWSELRVAGFITPEAPTPN